MSNKVSRAFSKVINLVVAATAQGASKGELGSPDTTEEMKSIARTAAEEGIVMQRGFIVGQIIAALFERVFPVLARRAAYCDNGAAAAL